MMALSDGKSNGDPGKSMRKQVLYLIGNLEEDTLTEIVDVLASLGVGHIDDLKFVTKEDLEVKVKPVHARKLLRSYVDILSPSTSSPRSPVSSMDSSMSFSPKSPSPIMYQNMQNVNMDPNWPVKMELPWKELSVFIMESLDQGKRLAPAAKKELIRVVVDAVRKKTEHATRPQMSVVAQRMVAKYPDSLQDQLEGSIIGCGYESVLTKLVSRNENLNRPVNANKMCLSHKKRPLCKDSDSSDYGDSSGSGCTAAAAARRDSYGCINWMPVCTVSSAWEAMESEKQSLKSMFDDSNTDFEKIDSLMMSSYALQRKDINSGTSMKELRSEWPCLFEVKGLLAHAKELLGIGIRNALGTAYADKAVRINRFLKQKANAKCELIYEEARKQSNQDNIKAWLMAVVLCVMEHFGEKEDELFFVMDETAAVAEAEKSTAKESPMLIVLGDSVLAGKHYMLMCDKMVISPRIPSFMDAFSALFAAFYVFNLEYPAGASTTMEFVQRCFIGINPDRGSKGNSGKKKKTKMNPKVLTLISNLADFEWLVNP